MKGQGMLHSGAIHPLDTGNYLMIEESMCSLKSSFKFGITWMKLMIGPDKKSTREMDGNENFKHGY